MRSPCVCVNFASKAVYQSLHQLTIIQPILGSATLVTGNKSWELPTNCRKTMLELVRISRLNVCHRRDDLESPSTRKPSDRRERRIKYDAETADENVHLATETSSPALVPDLPAAAPSQLSPDPTLLHIELLTACQWVSEFRLGQQTAERYRWIDAFAVNRTGSDGVF